MLTSNCILHTVTFSCPRPLLLSLSREVPERCPWSNSYLRAAGDTSHRVIAVISPCPTTSLDKSTDIVDWLRLFNGRTNNDHKYKVSPVRTLRPHSDPHQKEYLNTSNASHNPLRCPRCVSFCHTKRHSFPSLERCSKAGPNMSPLFSVLRYCWFSPLPFHALTFLQVQRKIAARLSKTQHCCLRFPWYDVV